MKKKIYYIQPTYQTSDGTLLKGDSLYVHSLAMPALSAATPSDWEKNITLQYFEDIDYDTDASVIAITSMGYDIAQGIEIAREFRRRNKTVIFGGYQAHFSSHLLIKDVCDCVVHGNPGPEDMRKILIDAESNQLEREYHFGIDINFPFDYSVLADKKITFMPVLSSIGCINDCDFCCTAAVYKGQCRLRKIEYVIEDLKSISRISKKAGFVDNNIYNNRKYLLKLLKAIIDNEIKLKWGAQVTIDIGDDPEILDYLYKAGCRLLFIGMETVNQENLAGVNKKYLVQSYKERLRNINRSGIKVAGYFMFGFDNDTTETPQMLYDFISSGKISLPILNILVPVPGTRIFQKLKQENRLLFEEEQELLKNNSFYNSACNTCFYIPKLMTAEEAENGFLELYGKLAGYSQIIKRSLCFNPFMMAFLLGMNIVFRREYLDMRKKHKL
ncbi:MAG: radical SAM protein [Ignavibacteria bacterium]|nr:radical SAM protein [Ignavibacteria bacterium]